MNLITTRRIIGLAAVLVSTLMAACGLRSTTASTETLTVYEDKPTLKLLDLGPPGNSPGEFDAGQPVVRAILGGTGKYMGARGQLASTRNADGSYTLGVYAAQVMRIEARRIGATPLGNRLGIEPNCLGREKSVYRLICVRA
jgi:hypothetical protein